VPNLFKSCDDNGGMRFVATIAITGLVAAAIVSLGAAAAPSSTARIVYRSVRLANPQRPPELYSVQPSGAGRRLLALRADQPALSPDRTRIAFAGAGLAREGIWVMRADGRGQRRLTTRAGDGEPTWSPDGRRIAFRRDQGGSFDLWVVPAAGGSARRLFGGRSTSELAPDWSPAGGQIAFQGNRGGINQIWILTLRTHGVRRLTRGADSFQPDWSPDGRWIAYSTQGRIAVARANGTGTRLLSTGVPRSAYNPSWSRDGRQIAFERGGQVLRMSAGGGGLRYVTRAAWGTNGNPDW
jgi:Tol biopolymer transport system component